VLLVVVLTTPFLAKNLYDLFYNDGLFDNSKGALTIKYVTDTAGKIQKVALNSNGTFTDVNGGTLLQTATDGTVREVILRLSG
jgi:hypothetical protein